MSDNRDKKDKNNVPHNALVERQPSFAFMSSKAERLVTALYMVSKFMPEEEPLRSELRAKGVSLLSHVFMVQKPDNVNVLSNIVLEIIGLLDVAHKVGYISQMNWTIIRREYESFVRFLEEQYERLSTKDAATIQDDFFHVKSDTAISEPTPPVLKDKKDIQGQRKETPVHKQKSPAVSEKKTERRTAILDLLKKQKQITVRDATRVIPQVSEKTLQRELIALVDEGVLKREGERRWSTYFLA